MVYAPRPSEGVGPIRITKVVVLRLWSRSGHSIGHLNTKGRADRRGYLAGPPWIPISCQSTAPSVPSIPDPLQCVHRSDRPRNTDQQVSVGVRSFEAAMIAPPNWPAIAPPPP